MEYVYISYKTDREYFTNERELLVMEKLWLLEKSVQKERASNDADERRLEVDLYYDLERLRALNQ